VRRQVGAVQPGNAVGILLNASENAVSFSLAEFRRSDLWQLTITGRDAAARQLIASAWQLSDRLPACRYAEADNPGRRRFSPML